LEFIESSQLPKFDARHGKPYRWIVWHIKRKGKKSRYNEYTSQKTEADKQWYEIVCLSVNYQQWLTLGHTEGICRSNHVFRLKFSNEEYEQILNETLEKEVVLQKLNECSMEDYGIFYC